MAYVADTNPRDASSYLRMSGIQGVAGGVRIEWQGGMMATQFLQHRLRLDDTNALWTDIFTNPPPTPFTGSFTNHLGTNSLEFYRIRVER